MTHKEYCKVVKVPEYKQKPDGSKCLTGPSTSQLSNATYDDLSKLIISVGGYPIKTVPVNYGTSSRPGVDINCLLQLPLGILPLENNCGWCWVSTQ